MKTPEFKLHDEVMITNPVYFDYMKTGVIVRISSDPNYCVVCLKNGQYVNIKTDSLNYTLEKRIEMLCPDDKALVLEIIPGKWVAYDDSSMYFSAFANNATPVFQTKAELIGELSAVHMDGRKHKTINRKRPGIYWYTYPNIDNKREKHTYVIEQVTSENMNRLRETCLQGLCPADYE